MTAPLKAVRVRAPAMSEGRKLILDTAARLFREEGYASISLRDIAGEAGMKAASLYHHFSSKAEILGEVLRIGVERVHEEVRKCVAELPADATAETVLRTAVYAHLRALWELHDYTSANVRIFGQVPAEVKLRHLPTRDAYERYWAELLKGLARRGELDRDRDLRLARLFLITALNGSLEWFQGGAVSLKAMAYELSELLMNGLGAPSGRHEADTERRS